MDLRRQWDLLTVRPKKQPRLGVLLHKPGQVEESLKIIWGKDHPVIGLC